jgi:SAM-dependent methyltransferase
VFSPGCGAAEKEMVLAQALPDRRFVAADITEAPLEAARAECARRRIANLELRIGDFNAPDLEPRSLDAVLGLGAIHHVSELERFWAEVRKALRPGGVVLAQEYVGPNRMQWRPAQIEHGNRALATIVPLEHQVHHREVKPTPVEQMLELDPSEAVRSEDLLPTCKDAGFEVLGYAGVGCALLQPVLLDQVHTFDPRNWQHNLVLTHLFVEEDRLMREGVLGDDFAMFVAAAR